MNLLQRSPAINLVNARANSISGTIDNFSVLTGDGESLSARRLILSYGVVDQMPVVPGFAESWGTSVIPCPYCECLQPGEPKRLPDAAIQCLGWNKPFQAAQKLSLFSNRPANFVRTCNCCHDFGSDNLRTACCLNG